jgi:hypothetical protein
VGHKIHSADRSSRRFLFDFLSEKGSLSLRAVQLLESRCFLSWGSERTQSCGGT